MADGLSLTLGSLKLDPKQQGILMSMNEKYQEKLKFFDDLKFNEKISSIIIKYAPFDLVMPNIDANVIFVGISPGAHQMKKSFEVLDECIQNSKDYLEFEKIFRMKVPFDGSMRINLVKMLDEVGLNKYLGINSTDDLFSSSCRLAEMTSLLTMPVFIKNNKNYSGTPLPCENPQLLKLVQTYFVNDLKRFKKDTLIIPFGKTVYMTLKELGVTSQFKVLENFPHPSGANGHRKTLFERYKESYKKMLNI